MQHVALETIMCYCAKNYAAMRHILVNGYCHIQQHQMPLSREREIISEIAKIENDPICFLKYPRFEPLSLECNARVISI